MKVILISAAVAFSLTLTVYTILSGRNPVNRIGFALFVSLFPAVLTLVIVKLMRLSETWWRVVLVYAVVFIATALTQAVLRSIG